MNYSPQLELVGSVLRNFTTLILEHMKLKNYALGQWVEGAGEGKSLYNAVNGQLVAQASSDGLDFGAILNYGRETGGPALRKMTFQERGRMLKALALHLYGMKDKFYPVSLSNRGDQSR